MSESPAHDSDRLKGSCVATSVHREPIKAKGDPSQGQPLAAPDDVLRRLARLHLNHLRRLNLKGASPSPRKEI